MNNDNHDNESGNETGKDRTNTGRRRALQALGVGGALVGAHALPEKWTRPVVDAVSLPAHAQTSSEGGFFGQDMSTVEGMMGGGIDLHQFPITHLAATNGASWLDYLISPAAATEDAVLFLEASISEKGDCRFSFRVQGTLPDSCLEGEKEDEPEPIDFTLCWRGSFDKVAKGQEAVLSINCPEEIIAEEILAKIVNLDADMLELATGPGDVRLDLTRSDNRANCPSCDEEFLALKEECVDV